MTHPIQSLLDLMAALRDPQTGCPWDVEQTFASIVPHTIEEAYEVADAIERGHMPDLKDELGDLLLQVVFYSQMAREEGLFTFESVVENLSEKLIRRHPHVFGESRIHSAEEQTEAWEAIKATEKTAGQSILDGVTAGLPPMLRAMKLQKKAAKIGFDWPNAEAVLVKLAEETTEVKEAIDSGNREAMEDELGDLLFVLVNLARKLDLDPERALRQANRKFERRFRHMEGQADLQGLTLEEQEQLWMAAKRAEAA